MDFQTGFSSIPNTELAGMIKAKLWTQVESTLPPNASITWEVTCLRPIILEVPNMKSLTIIDTCTPGTEPSTLKGLNKAQFRYKVVAIRTKPADPRAGVLTI